MYRWLKACAVSLLTFLTASLAFAQFNFFNPMFAEPLVHVPANIQQPAPVVVMLHGCTQDGSTFAQSTRMNEVADKNGFIVIYPQQSRTRNPLNCFNWFDSSNQVRGTDNELAKVMEAISNVGNSVLIDTNRIYVAGFSAGGAMASLLMACYSDVFAAGAVHSGLPFAAAVNQWTAFSVMSNPNMVNVSNSASAAAKCAGKVAQPMPVFTIHGTNDTVVHPGHSQLIIDQSILMNDQVDDGELNGSVDADIFSSEPVPGDLQASMFIYNKGRYPTTAALIIKGMDHAWSGGNSRFQYTDERGPDVSDLIWQFFYRHYRQSSATEGFYGN